MKIGLSFSRCLRDIVEGTVDIDDVLVVIARTNFDPHNDEQWLDIWTGYGGGTEEIPMGSFNDTNSEWAGFHDEDQFRSVSIELWERGKLHQPRKFGARIARRDEYWLETCLPNSELERNPAAKKAWEQFQVVAGLTNVKLDKDYQ